MDKINSSSSISITDTDIEKTEQIAKEMKHYIINGKKREDYFRIFFILITLSFIMGFALGFWLGVPTETEELATANPTQGVSKTDQATPVKVTALTAKQRVKKANVQRKSTAVKPKPVKTVPPRRRNTTPTSTVSEKSTQDIASKTEKSRQEESVATASDQTSDKSPTQYLVQVGRFPDKDSASSFVEQLAESGFKVFTEESISTIGNKNYNVNLGPYAEMNIAQDKMSDFQSAHNTSAQILTTEK